MQQPKAVEELSFSDILTRKKDKLKEIIPAIANNLVDSDPAIAILEEAAYTEGLLRNRLNNSILAVTIQFASGTDLDNLGKFYGIERKLITEEDTSTIPPTPAVWENDEDLRRRILEAPKGFSVAGPRAAYVYYGKLADNKVKDISANSPSPGVVDIAVLSYDGDGTADNDLLQKVADRLNDEDTRPLGDKVNVASAEIISFEVVLEIEVDNTPNLQLIIAEVQSNIQSYVDSTHRIGSIVAISGIYAACHNVDGVNRVILSSPAADIEATYSQAPYCTNIDVSLHADNPNPPEEETDNE